MNLFFFQVGVFCFNSLNSFLNLTEFSHASIYIIFHLSGASSAHSCTVASSPHKCMCVAKTTIVHAAGKAVVAKDTHTPLKLHPFLTYTGNDELG